MTEVQSSLPTETAAQRAVAGSTQSKVMEAISELAVAIDEVHRTQDKIDEQCSLALRPESSAPDAMMKSLDAVPQEKSELLDRIEGLARIVRSLRRRQETFLDRIEI